MLYLVHWELFLKMVKQILKRVRKEIKIQQSENSIEALIERKEWPKGGLLELQNAIRYEMDWVYNMARANSLPTNKSIYNRYMNLLSASIYCFSCQGRIGAIEDLKLHQGKELLKDGVVLTSKFKTSSKFGYQPVTLPPDKVSTFLLQYYLMNVRPNYLQEHDDPLFISFTGTKYNVAKGLSTFFAQTLSLKITSTRIRAIVETSFQDLLDDGAITTLQKHAISNVNGHDSQTTKDYYLKRSRLNDAQNSFEAFNIFDELHNVFDEEFSTSAASDDNITELDTQQSEPSAPALSNQSSCLELLSIKSNDLPPKGFIGCKHPYFNKSENQMRAPWTEYEIDFVGKWCETNIINNPTWSKSILSKCCKYIKTNPEIREHFHQLHIFDSGRLRHGWETYQKKKKE